MAAGHACVYCSEPLRAALNSLTGWRHYDGRIACANEIGLACVKESPAIAVAVRARRIAATRRLQKPG